LQPGDGSAGSALTAEIIAQLFAIGRLREHSRQRKFPHAARPGEQHGVRDPSSCEHAAKRGYDSRITKEFGEWHRFFISFGAGLP
jgi:hypothetical protein